MASLYFKFGSMNCGKSTALIQVAYNYRERNQNALVITPAIDNRYGTGKVTSRIGVSLDARTFKSNNNLYEDIAAEHYKENIDCVLVDEAQFLTEEQVWQLTDVVDEIGIPVMCYGLRTDAFGKAFEGSAILLSIADKVDEMKSICHCGSKANMVLRIDEDGKVVTKGNQVEIGGNDRYIAVCRKHYKERFNQGY